MSVKFWRTCCLWSVGLNVWLIYQIFISKPDATSFRVNLSAQRILSTDSCCTEDHWARCYENKYRFFDATRPASTVIAVPPRGEISQEYLCPSKYVHCKRAIQKKTIDQQNMLFKPENSQLVGDTLYGDKVLNTFNALGKTLTVDDICFGTQWLSESLAMYSYTNFLGVPLQQNPADAFVIMDLLWRLKPDLLIELGTAGGGSALFYSFIMTSYNPDAHVLTIDPKRTQDWNARKVRKLCPHCTYARDLPMWTSGVIEFHKDVPANLVSVVEARIAEWGSKRVMMIEDGNHFTKTVLQNLKLFGRFVTPGSFILVQDTKMRRLYNSTVHDPRGAARRYLDSPEGQNFTVDRTFEYYLCTEHTNGFLKRREEN